jgi:hypothetical protein
MTSNLFIISANTIKAKLPAKGEPKIKTIVALLILFKPLTNSWLFSLFSFRQIFAL